MPSEQELSPAQVFDQFFGPAIFQPGARLLLNYAAPKVGEHVLDLACGTGSVALLAAPLVGAQGQVIGIDINSGMLQVARTQPVPAGAAIDWREGDAGALPLEDNALDVLLCQQGVQFFPDRHAAVREMRRVLREGGRLALNVWQALEQHEIYEALSVAQARHLDVSLSQVTAPWSFPDASELEQLLIDGGFRNIKIVSESFQAQFPSVEQFVYLTLFASSAFLDEFDWNNVALRSALIEDVNRALEAPLRRYQHGEGLTIPVYWNFAVAFK